jgi:hypothetical protein
MRWTTSVLLTVAGLALAGFAAPPLAFNYGQRRARECLARIEAPRGPELPRCDAIGRWFRWTERVPWTRHQAARAREELDARMAVAEYVDAAVGVPDQAHLEQARARVLAAGEAVHKGTGLLRLSELGAVIPTPDLGELAFDVGDAGALDARAFDWTQWFTSKHAIEAALLRADLARAARLAEHYAGRPDHDLRLPGGALLCSSGQVARGMEEIASVESARAEKRNANFARNFGSARVLLEACAALGAELPPAVPSYGSAGEWDQRERLAVARLRLAERHPGCGPPPRLAGCTERARINEAASELLDMLDSPGPLEFRAELLGAVGPFVTDAAIAVELARPRGEEPAPKTRLPLTLQRMVEPGSPAAPFVPAADLVHGADALLALRPEHRELRALGGTLLGLAARAQAGMGERAVALELGRRAAPLATEDDLATALFESSVASLAGDDDGAIATLEHALAAPRAPEPMVAAAWLQLGSLRAAVGRHAEALAAARQGLDAAHAARHAVLSERGEWLLLALEAQDLAQARSDGPSPQGQGAAAVPEQLPFVGVPDPSIPDEVRARQLAATLAVWRRWVQDPSAERRAHRYAAMHARGDAAEARTEHLVLAGLLVDSPSEVEPWLDAYYALDAGSTSIRAYAWARYQAARWRGDSAAAARWLARFRALARWADDPLRGDLYQELRL